jgi:hypothetical protein
VLVIYKRKSAQTYISVFALFLAYSVATAAELKKETIDSFDRHIAKVEARLAPRFRGEHFLWSDSSPEIHQQVAKGVVVVQPADVKGTVQVKGGLIHDWMGAAFVPGATLAQALKFVQDYRSHKGVYPEVADAQVKSHQGDDFNVRMRIVRSKFFLSDVLYTEQDIHFYKLDATRVYSRAYSTRITEVGNPGTPSEHELPVGNDRGLLWRLNVYWFFEERDHGVYIECEAITLTRDVPFGAGKLFSPIVQSVPAESVRTSVEQTRKAILAQSKS